MMFAACLRLLKVVICDFPNLRSLVPSIMRMLWCFWSESIVAGFSRCLISESVVKMLSVRVQFVRLVSLSGRCLPFESAMRMVLVSVCLGGEVRVGLVVSLSRRLSFSDWTSVSCCFKSSFSVWSAVFSSMTCSSCLFLLVSCCRLSSKCCLVLLFTVSSALTLVFSSLLIVLRWSIECLLACNLVTYSCAVCCVSLSVVSMVLICVFSLFSFCSFSLSVFISFLSSVTSLDSVGFDVLSPLGLVPWCI